MLAESIIAGRGLPTAEQVNAAFPDQPAIDAESAARLSMFNDHPQARERLKQFPPKLTPTAAKLVREMAVAGDPELPDPILYVRIDAYPEGLGWHESVIDTVPTSALILEIQGIKVWATPSMMNSTIDAENRELVLR